VVLTVRVSTKVVGLGEAVPEETRDVIVVVSRLRVEFAEVVALEAAVLFADVEEDDEDGAETAEALEEDCARAEVQRVARKNNRERVTRIVMSFRIRYLEQVTSLNWLCPSCMQSLAITSVRGKLVDS
jgi:hypothetical protein